MISLRQLKRKGILKRVEGSLQTEDEGRLSYESLREWDEKCKCDWRKSMEYEMKNPTIYDQNGLNY